MYVCVCVYVYVCVCAERERRKQDERDRRHEEKKAEKQRAKDRVRSEREVDESDGGGVLDALRLATALAPEKRPTVQVRAGGWVGAWPAWKCVKSSLQ